MIDNHDGDELKQQPQAKYDAILALENTENEGVVDTLEINFEVDTKNENLFEEPSIEAVDSLINTVPATTIDSTSTPKQ